MRLAPAPLFFASDPQRAVRLSGESSRTTHGAETCIDACRYFGGLLVGAAGGAAKADLLSPRYAPAPGMWDEAPPCAEFDEVARGVLPPQGTAGDRRERLRRRIAGGGAVGLRQGGGFRGRLPPRGQSGRRCGHHRRHIRPDRRRALRPGGRPGALAPARRESPSRPRPRGQAPARRRPIAPERRPDHEIGARSASRSSSVSESCPLPPPSKSASASACLRACISRMVASTVPSAIRR